MFLFFTTEILKLTSSSVRNLSVFFACMLSVLYYKLWIEWIVCMVFIESFFLSTYNANVLFEKLENFFFEFKTLCNFQLKHMIETNFFAVRTRYKFWNDIKYNTVALLHCPKLKRISAWGCCNSLSFWVRCRKSRRQTGSL